MNLQELGITQEELIERVVDRAADKAMGDQFACDEDGEPVRVHSDVERRLQEKVRERIDAAVEKVADEHILPNAQQYIDQVTLQKTNQWGEAKGESVTFREYLVQRAEAYMTEPVDLDGKSKSEARGGIGGFRASGTRIEHMIDKHLKYHIEKAMQEAFRQANNSIAEGLNQAMRQKIDEVRDSIKIEAKVKR